MTEPTVVTSTAVETQQASCSGGNDGKAMATGAGGVAPYSYQWDAAAGSQTTQEATNLAAGTYSVTVTDVNGCKSSTTATVTSPSGLTSATSVFSNVSCNGASDGAIDLMVSGGTPPYAYNWNNGAITEDLFNISGGTYNVTITDANGCTTNATATVNEPAVLTDSMDITFITCPGDADGAVDLIVSGGTAPYTYAWSHGPTTEDLSNIPAGFYYVTITDANGCTKIDTAKVREPAFLVGTIVVTDVTCNGGSDGQLDLSTIGGRAPYTFAWDNGAGTVEDPTGLTAGTYTVTITDTAGCTSTATATINEPTALVLSTTGTNVTCNGDGDGTIDLSVTGGITPYTYAWSNTSTSEDLSNLAPGTYVVTVTDGNGCTDTISRKITEPAVLASSISATNIACYNEATGTVDLTVTGGTGPYSYSWSNGATTEDLSNLANGTYQVTITDANGCTATNSVVLTQPSSPIQINPSGSIIACFNGTTGTASTNVTGGNAPYTYAWSNGATTSGLTNVGAGVYVVSVTDANGCTKVDTATVLQNPDMFLGTSNVTDASCNGSADGAINIGVSGGVGPYTYAWSNSSTSKNQTGLTAGTYTLTVTDNAACTKTFTFTVNEPAPISVASVITNVNCFGAANGSISLTVTGGIAPYTYQWGNSIAGNTPNVTGLSGGTYIVAVIDANNCVKQETFTITEPASALSLSLTKVDATCLGNNDGSIDLTVTGGTAPYTFAWSNNATSEDLTNIQSGNYTVTVTDANGCTETTSTFVAQPSGISTSVSVTDVGCHGDSTGSIDLTLSGGTAPYTFAWSDGSTNEDLMNVPAGTYSVTITDANGCMITNGQSVSQPTPLGVAGTVTDASCNNANGGNDGSIMVTPSGGTSPYTYAWSNGAGNTNMISGLVAGSYDVTVTDANGCTLVSTFAVGEPTLLLAVANVTTDIICEGDLGSISGIVGGGTAPYTVTWTDPNGMPITNLVDLSVSGTYTATVVDANGCTATATATLSTPIPIVVSNVGVTDVLCFGEATGGIGITASGGTGLLSFSWSNASIGNTSNPTGLGAGTYIYTISDGNSCTFTDTVVVNEPAAALSATTSSVADTNGTGVGTATVTASGGTAPYTYQWDSAASNATTAVVTGLAAGTYSVTVTDDNGCTEEATVTVNNIVNNTIDIDYVMDLGIFPNPTRGQVTIEFELSRFADVNVVIYNVAGQMVQDLGHYNTTREQLRVDMSMYADGVYFVRFIVEDEVFTRKLILSK